MTIDTAALLATLTTGLASLRAASPRATTRTLTAADAATLVESLTEALDLVTPDDVSVTLTAHGGIVPNSYKYRAESDEIRVSIDLATGTVKASVTRGDAPKRAHGKGDWYYIRAAKAGQSTGRILV